jgi:hypothetical protein
MVIDAKYQIVTNHYVMSYIKQSEFFVTNLGVSATMDKNGDRLLNENDKFAGSYTLQYKTTIYAQGTVGDIFFYVDYSILDNNIAAYHRLEEFIFDFDEVWVREKGVSSYLGFLLKSIDTDYAKRKGLNQIDNKEVYKQGQAEKIMMNPGAVTYDDIKAYIQQKRI